MSESDNKRVQRKQRAAHLGPTKRRPMVLDAALELFAEHGYQGTSMDAVADKIGVTKPVVYECFANKLVMFEALLAREEERLATVMGRLVARDQNGKIVDANDQMLIDSLLGTFQSVIDHPNSWKVLYLTEHGTASEVVNRVERGRRRQVALTTDIVKARLQRLGVKDGVDRKALIFSTMLVGLGDGLVRALLKDPTSFTPQELSSAVASVVIAGEKAFSD